MHHPHRRREAGSAYIIALLVLVVLTILGLGITLIAQTEMQLGANEKTIQRVFYAADAGLNKTIARALVTADYTAAQYNIGDPLPGTSPLVDSTFYVQQVDVSPFYPIMTAPCNLCEINGAGEYGREPYFKVNYGVTAAAARYHGASTEPSAGKTLSSLVEVQPWQLPVDALAPLDDPTVLAEIKF